LIEDAVLKEARRLIGEMIARRRAALGMTQETLAEKAGVGIATVKVIEIGKFYVSLKILLKMCYALDLYFFFEEKESETELATMMRERWGKIGKN
jgi:transcriptional regulator with XRE-family HTH domain